MGAAAISPAERAACENAFSMPESVSFPTFALIACSRKSCGRAVD
jgi:hypothetical protein